MFAIIWNPSGFYAVDRFRNHAKMNSAYFVTNMPIPLEQAIFRRGRAAHQKLLVTHVDNSSVHKSRVSTSCLEEQGIPCILYPPYIPGLIQRLLFVSDSERKTRKDSGMLRRPAL
jgi:hypothetical protein